MDKKAFTLTEVLISVMLISVVIAAILQMQQNNLHFLEKYKSSSLNDGYINYAATVNHEQDTKIFLDSIVSFKDDEIRKELKEIRVNLDVEDGEDIKLPENDYITNIGSKKYTYTIEDEITKIFYEFTIE